MAIVITVLFIGSIGGLALYGTGSILGTSGLPESRFLKEPLDLNQRQILFANYGAYISADLPSCGLQCETVGAFLRQMPNQYSPFIFLYENMDAENFFITLEGFNGTRTYNNLENFDFEAFEDELCAQLHPSIPACKARKLLQ